MESSEESVKKDIDIAGYEPQPYEILERDFQEVAFLRVAQFAFRD